MLKYFENANDCTGAVTKEVSNGIIGACAEIKTNIWGKIKTCGKNMRN